MFQLNDDKSIYVTRGDIGHFAVTAVDDGEKYIFKAGDLVRIKVYGKKDASNIVLQKDFPVTEEAESVDIILTEKDTKIGEVISKPKDYWYEVELNPLSDPQTIIGYDDDGAKVFRLFPEGRDLTENDPVITPEDIPIVDDALDLTSKRPIENHVIARAIAQINGTIKSNDKKVAEQINHITEDAVDLRGAVAVERARIDNIVAPDASESRTYNLEYVAAITDEMKSKIEAVITSDGIRANLKVKMREANIFYDGTGLTLFVFPDLCRPLGTGLLHTEDGLNYTISYDLTADRYYLSIAAQSGVTAAPSAAGEVTITYSLSDLEARDIRIGANGETYNTAGTSVRGQFSIATSGIDNANKALCAVVENNLDGCEILKKASDLELENATSGISKSEQIFGIFEVIPSGLSKISVATNKPLTLYFFDVLDDPGETVDAGTMVLKESKTFYPVGGEVCAYVNADKPYMLGLKGSVQYKLNADSPCMRRLMDIAESDDTYSYAMSVNVCFDLSVTIYGSVKELGRTETKIPVPVTHAYCDLTHGYMHHMAGKVVSTPVCSLDGYKYVTIVAADSTDVLFAYVFDYGDDGVYKGYRELSATGALVFQPLSKYFRVAISTKGLTDADYYDAARIAEIKLEKPKNIEFAEMPESGFENFSVEVNYHATMQVTEDAGKLMYTDYGVLALPDNYDPSGKPTRLIILCQGTGERTGADTNPLSNHGWSYFLSKGYAVMDMNGMALEWGAAQGFPVTNQHYCNKYLLQSYKKGYEYVTKKYNLKKEVFLAGISMGGGASALIAQSRILPVIAHVAFCPALSVYKQDYMKPWGGENQQKTIAGQWGFDGWDTTTPSQGYFLQNIDKIKGFDNLLINTFGSTKDAANQNYGNDAEAAAYNALCKIYPVPLKIWHCTDDNTVLYRYSEFMVNMIKNADGMAWLRNLGSGGHVGGWNIGTMNDTDVNGNSISTSVPFYEAVLFMQQYES